jgi:hypothetical protein
VTETRTYTPHRLLGWSTRAIAGAAAIVLVGLAPWADTPSSDASFTDEAAATLALSGAYDIALEAPDASGTPQLAEGAPQDLALQAPDGAQFSLTTAVTWTVAVVNQAAAGTVTVTLSDPVNTPFTIGQTHYPDLFHYLLVTLTDTASGDVLVTGPADDLAGRPIDLGHLDTDQRRELTVSAVLAPGTWSVYDSRTTSLRLTFQGTT